MKYEKTEEIEQREFKTWKFSFDKQKWKKYVP